MKKLWLFIIVFTFATLILATAFREEYINYSNKIFSEISFNLKEFAYSFDGLARGKQLKEENEKLKAELLKNTNLLAENQLLKRENEELYELLKLNKEIKRPMINAQVIDINTTTDFTLTINKGVKSGVSLGDVCVWGGSLVGYVKEVFDDFSHITPIISPGSTVGIMDTEGNTGIISGSLALFKRNMCEISFFLDTIEAKNGETIVTSGLSDIYPKGLTVGKINIDGDKKRLMTEVDFTKIRTVSLICSR